MTQSGGLSVKSQKDELCHTGVVSNIHLLGIVPVEGNLKIIKNVFVLYILIFFFDYSYTYSQQFLLCLAVNMGLNRIFFAGGFFFPYKRRMIQSLSGTSIIILSLSDVFVL